MNWRALLMQPAILSAVTSIMFGGGQAAPNPAAIWLNRAATLFGILAVGMGLFFGWLWLSARYPLETAALYFSAIMALACIISALAAAGFARYRQVRRWIWQKKLMEKVENATDFAVNELETFGRDNPKTAVTLSALAGYLLADRAADGMEKLLDALDLTNNHEGDRHHV